MKSIAAFLGRGTLADHGFVCLKATLPAALQNGNEFQISRVFTTCQDVRSWLDLMAVVALFYRAAPATTRSDHQEESSSQGRCPGQTMPLSSGFVGIGA
jgi:hypothetical protein